MIVRIYTGQDGQTHFEDLPMPAKESHSVALQAGANLVFRRFPADYWDAGAAAAWFPALTTMAGLQANWDFLSDFKQRGTLALDALRAQAAQSPLGCGQQWPHSGRAASARHGGEVSSRLTPVDNWPSEPGGGHVGHRRSGFIPTIEFMPLGRGSPRRACVTLHLRHGGIRLRIPPPAAMSQSASISDL